MDQPWRNWKHITKLDPDRKISAEGIKTVVESGTNAVMVSGTQGVTREKVQALVNALKDYDIPVVLEPSNPKSIVYNDIDYIFVPSVFNTNNARWINGLHKTWVKYDNGLNWDIVVPEAYIILNPKCRAARVTKAIPLKREDVIAAAVTAEQFFKFPIIYIEYSGVYGDPSLVADVKKALKYAHLIYGGGINSKERAEEMSKYATIVVGNTIYENGTKSLIETVKGVLERIKKLRLKKKS